MQSCERALGTLEAVPQVGMLPLRQLYSEFCVPCTLQNNCFPRSRILDISFNLLRNIEGVDKLTKLKKLFLVNNKINKIENLSNLHQLEMLELGSNRIRVGVGMAWGYRMCIFHRV